MRMMRYINYSRKGNNLIGMDILQHWDIHMGTSRITGKKLFLACPEDSICLEYCIRRKFWDEGGYERLIGQSIGQFPLPPILNPLIFLGKLPMK